MEILRLRQSTMPTILLRSKERAFALYDGRLAVKSSLHDVLEDLVVNA